MLEDLRREMDKLDAQLVKVLADRMELSRKIGEAKLAEGTPIHQKTREIAVLDKAKILGNSLGLNDTFLTDLYSLILSESRKSQGSV